MAIDGRTAFGRNLREARQAAGLTQERVGELCGVHMSEVSRIERGQRDPRLTTILRLADAVGTSAEDLVRGVKF